MKFEVNDTYLKALKRTLLTEQAASILNDIEVYGLEYTKKKWQKKPNNYDPNLKCNQNPKVHRGVKLFFPNGLKSIDRYNIIVVSRDLKAN